MCFQNRFSFKCLFPQTSLASHLVQGNASFNSSAKIGFVSMTGMPYLALYLVYKRRNPTAMCFITCICSLKRLTDVTCITFGSVMFFMCMAGDMTNDGLELPNVLAILMSIITTEKAGISTLLIVLDVTHPWQCLLSWLSLGYLGVRIYDHFLSSPQTRKCISCISNLTTSSF